MSKKKKPVITGFSLERAAGIEPATTIMQRPRPWWAGLDLNQRTALAGQIYSLVPLTTRPPTHDGDSRRYVGHRTRSSSKMPGFGKNGREQEEKVASRFDRATNVARAGIAQLVEQLICNQQVVGSSPTAGLRTSPRLHRPPVCRRRGLASRAIVARERVSMSPIVQLRRSAASLVRPDLPRPATHHEEGYVRPDEIGALRRGWAREARTARC